MGDDTYIEEADDIECRNQCSSCKLRYDCTDSDTNQLQRSNDRNRD